MSAQPLTSGGVRTAGAPQTDRRRESVAAPRLTRGLRLLGDFEGSGFVEPHYLVRRADGHIVHLSRLLHLVATHIDGRRTLEEIAARVSRDFGREVSSDNVAYLVEHKLGPLGVAQTSDEDELPEWQDSLLAIRCRVVFMSQRVVDALARALQLLFRPTLVALILAAVTAVYVWLFALHGITDAILDVISQPLKLIAIFAISLVYSVVHELGHAAACRYSGARPGVMGVGIYIVWPVFYTDVSDSYRASRGGRIRTDLGGVYFEALCVLFTAGLYAVTGQEWLLLVVVYTTIEMIHQFLPVVRLDGYWLLTDLTGVPDLFGRMGPILKSLVPGRPQDPKVGELKPWARRSITAWVLFTVPVLGGGLLWLVANAPLIVRETWAAILGHAAAISEAHAAGGWATVGLSVIEILLLSFPILGGVFSFALLGRTLTSLIIRRWRIRAATAAGRAMEPRR